MTARFNKNVLSVINGRLGADFDPDLFSRRAAYDAKNERVEMWLDSEADQAVRAGDFGATFQKGEGLRTEISAKFTPDSAARTFEEVGLNLLDLYTDDGDLFALALGRPA